MVTVPLLAFADDEPDAVVLCVDGSVGEDPVRFVLDTGAATCSVPLTPTTRALHTASAEGGRGVSGATTGDAVVTLPTLAFGGVTELAVRASRYTDHPHRRPLLGMNALGHHRCHFRFRDDALDIDGHPPELHSVHHLETGPGGQPMVTARFAEQTAYACWDTGASLTVVDAGFADANPRVFQVGDATEGIDATGASVHSTRALMAECVIGGTTFAASACVIVDLGPVNVDLDPPMAMILGTPLLRQANWYFDFPGGQWGVSRA